MKKKKHREDELIGLHILEGLIFRHDNHSRRRHPNLHHFLPLLSAVCGCLLLLFAALSFLSPPMTTDHIRRHRVPVEKKNVFGIPTRGRIIGPDLWTSNRSYIFHGCSNARENFITAEMNTEPNRYLLIATSGGLNQQRTGIIDAVVAAYILKATLVVPKLDRESFWKDSSNFSDVFDVDWFIAYLSNDVSVIKDLPQMAGKIRSIRVPRKCDPKCYHAKILPVYEQNHVQAVELTKFDYRLSNWLEDDLQKLRCRVNYHALRFTHPILEMGTKLVERMRIKTMHFVALHLRYEPDMLAFSGCYYGGGEKEIKELGALRKRWKTLPKKDPDRERRNGKCPLRPREVGLMLRALGFGEDTHIYVASGEIYGGEEVLSPLKALFPNLHTKESIAKEELVEFSSYSTRMAALDFIVCDKSDVLVTNNNGNMAKILAGRRRYFGHKPTIRPNAKELHKLFLNRDNMTWDEFSSHVQVVQAGFIGEPNHELSSKKKDEFHENPSSCICKNSSINKENYVGKNTGWSYEDKINDKVFLEYDQELSETEYIHEENGIQGIL